MSALITSCARLPNAAAPVAQNETWDRIWPVLLTAGLALMAAVIVQAFVVPSIERRKRAEDRWERDARALGELLSFDVAEAHGVLVKDMLSLVALERFLDGTVSADGLLKSGEVKASLREAASVYRTALDRAAWIAGLVQSPRIDGQTRVSLFQLHFGTFYAWDLTDLSNRLLGLDTSMAPPDSDEIVTADRKARDARREFVNLITKMLEDPPFLTPRHRIKQAAKRAGKRTKNARAKPSR